MVKTYLNLFCVLYNRTKTEYDYENNFMIDVLYMR